MSRFRYALQAALARIALLEGAAGCRHRAAHAALEAQSARLCAVERARAEIARGLGAGGSAWHAQRCDLGLALLERHRTEAAAALGVARRELADARTTLEALRARRRKLEAHRSRRFAEHLAACERLDVAEYEEAALLPRGPSVLAFERETA
jgi:hypothetical protein